MKVTLDFRLQKMPRVMNDEVYQLIRKGFIYIAGRDRFYRPIIVFNASMYNTLLPDPEDVTSAHLFIFSYVEKYMFCKGHIENVHTIMDLGGQGFTNLPVTAMKPMI